MRYCQHCVTPDTRPNIVLDAGGVCNACRFHMQKKQIDWAKRERAFRQVVENAKSRSRGYDCLIPVSGGKDSTWQTVKCLEYGLNPLAVTWKTPVRTEIGEKNLKNLVSLGVDHMDYQVNPKVEKKFLLESLIRYGTPMIPMHMALFNIPLTIAVRFSIPLIVWGENSAFEYGGTEEESKGFELNEAWLKKYGVTHGTTAADWISPGLTKKEMTPYFGPSAAELKASGVLAVFLGYYFSWDPETSLKIAVANSFQPRQEGAMTGLYDYADIDDEFISIHHYIKWYKFGFTRLFDNLSLEIRNGRMTRERALAIIREKGDQTPRADIEKFFRFVNISEKQFWDILEKFRNPAVWKKENGRWIIPGYLLKEAFPS